MDSPPLYLSAMIAVATTNSEGDNFRFEYSLGGGAWSILATVNSANPQSYDVDLSASPLNGDLVVRVVDTDRSPVQSRQSPIMDSIHVDAMLAIGGYCHSTSKSCLARY